MYLFSTQVTKFKTEISLIKVHHLNKYKGWYMCKKTQKAPKLTIFEEIAHCHMNPHKFLFR